MIPSFSVANLEGSGLAKTEYDFSKKQTWVKTARSLTFLDETQELMNIYDHSPDDDGSNPTPFQWQKSSPSSHWPVENDRPPPLERTVSQPAVASASHNAASPADSPAHSWPDGGDFASLHLPEQSSYPAQSPAASVTPSDRTRTEPGSLTDTRHVPKRRRLTFESVYQSSVASESPVNPVAHQSPATPEPWSVGWTPSKPVSNDMSASEVDLVTLSGLETSVSSSLSRIYLESPAWPLPQREEAILLRHFVETLARNFDLTDPRAHFRNVVPQRAAVCPTLMNAIFALSARHLSRIGQYDPLVSNRYHQECLKHLIPMLDDTSAILDENLLASTIILRHLEELEVPISGQHPSDQHSHLLGAQAFIAAQERAAITGGLRQAAFWVGLRQEVYVAFVNQRPALPALEHCNVDRSFEAAEDHIWACRIIVQCADILRYCFGDGTASAASYAYLEHQVSQWYDSKPASFNPVFYRAPEGDEVFPEIWYVGDDLATGIQHYHLARILLSSHNPGIPKLGPGRTAALRAMDDEIKRHVRALCGMSLSNPSNAPAFTYAAMGASLAGDKFVEYREQIALLAVLQQCENMHAWPTGTAITNLKVAWGWDETENYMLPHGGHPTKSVTAEI
ncbi:Hypothetical predicted protein [Lecanosticta acicola]|uniref:Arca-like protein n=1 Tax=Lecanosticta acicola TaxID=111012 RepID=A0AAI8Z6Z8_9PEZI|nr:Hypothetical predicted protein [Lecanosticta acicola]